MKQRTICKGLTVAVTILFLVLSIQPSIATVQPETEIDVEPKDYLFQTIIDIANNPDVKNLLEQYDNDLFKVDIDRSVYRKLFFRNPRLLFNTLFTKPTMSVEYLNKCYNNGIEITNILGEDKALEIMESVEITDIEVFNEIYNIVKNDEELSGRLSILKEMNKEINPELLFQDNLFVCIILYIIAFGLFPIYMIFVYIAELFPDDSVLNSIFYGIAFPFGFLMIFSAVIGNEIGCWEWPPYY